MEQLKLKLHKHLELLILLIVLLFIVSSCGGGGGDDTPPGPTEQELAFEELAGAWTLENGGFIKVDNEDVSHNYAGFTLSFTNGGFTTTNAGDLFPATGTWDWVGESSTQITTGNGKQVTITSLSATTFEFTFTKTASNSVAGVSGNYAIKVTK